MKEKQHYTCWNCVAVCVKPTTQAAERPDIMRGRPATHNRESYRAECHPATGPSFTGPYASSPSSPSSQALGDWATFSSSHATSAGHPLSWLHLNLREGNRRLHHTVLHHPSCLALTKAHPGAEQAQCWSVSLVGNTSKHHVFGDRAEIQCAMIILSYKPI